MRLSSLLAVFGHPDDESLAAGGILAQHAAAGARTAVVTATWARDTQRVAELADALRILGHPDHVHTHRVTLLAAEAAGTDVYPDAGRPWTPSAVYLATHPCSSVKRIEEIIGARRAVHATPDDQVTDRVDVSPWLEQKVAAILAHGSEVNRGALPGLIARLSPMAREELLSTEWFIRRPLARSATNDQLIARTAARGAGPQGRSW